MFFFPLLGLITRTITRSELPHITHARQSVSVSHKIALIKCSRTLEAHNANFTFRNVWILRSASQKTGSWSLPSQAHFVLLHFHSIIWRSVRCVFFPVSQAYSSVSTADLKSRIKLMFVHVCYILQAFPQVLWIALLASPSQEVPKANWGCSDGCSIMFTHPSASWCVHSLFVCLQLPFLETSLWTKRTCGLSEWTG